MKKIEILAPAGSKESFIAAVEAGADALYCGLKDFSARSKAQNFSPQEFYNYVNFAHSKNVKVYAALNTLIKQNEIENAAKQINFIANAGADALIIQDFGIAGIVKKYFPQLKLHASTQMAIHNSYGAAQAEKAGFKRAVLARELSLNQIQSITEKNSIETEVFCHGALCFCVSGLCLMSSFIGGYSGNRGACAQPCRRKWNTGKKEGFYISPKDLKLSHYINDLKEAGVASLKIEGRMKNPQYVYKTVKAYKMLSAKNLTASIIQEANELLSQDFARPKTTFNISVRAKEIFSPDMPKQLGTYIGKVLDFNKGILTVKSAETVNKEDILKAADVKNDKYYKINILNLKQNNDIYEIETNSEFIGVGMDIFKTSDGGFEGQIKNIVLKAGIKKENLNVKEIKIDFPRFKTQAQTKEELFIKTDNPAWSQHLKNVDAKIILSLDKKNLSKTEGFSYFELPSYIIEEDLPLYQKTTDVLVKKAGAAFFLNNISHFGFFKEQTAEIYGGKFLYVLNSFAAGYLFKKNIKSFSFSVEDDFENISALSKQGLNGGVFYLSGFPLLGISDMELHPDLNARENILKSAKDNIRIIKSEGKAFVIPQYPVMLFNKIQKLKKLKISRFLIDLSFIPPNAAYIASLLDAYKGKRPLQNDFEFNFERGLK